MNAIRIAFSEFIGLFVDDGNLALLVVVLIATVTLLVKFAHLPPLDGGGLLLLGCILVLVESLVRAARKKG